MGSFKRNATTVTVSSSNIQHGFSSGDFACFRSADVFDFSSGLVNWDNDNNKWYDGGYEITVISPYIFQYTTSSSGNYINQGNITVTTSTASNGMKNTGGGAGGIRDSEPGGRTGGSGIVIVRYKYNL
jgi:hypothetical protein